MNQDEAIQLAETIAEHLDIPSAGECPACEAFSTVVDKLMTLCDRQQKMLMSFNRAGLNLANHEVKLAELEIERKRTEADGFKARAQLERAEALKITAEDAAPAPRFGTKGHTRTRVGVPG